MKLVQQTMSEIEIKRLVFFDPLTGLPTRGNLIDRLKSWINDHTLESQKFGLICIDLDHFKWVNDSLGFDSGDKLLVQAAERIKESVCTDGEVFRIGNDEFIVFIHAIQSTDNLRDVTAQIMNSFKYPILVENHEIRVTLSAGIIIFPDHGSVANHLMRNAENAMYQAKQNGGNLFVIYQHSDEEGDDSRFLFKSQFEVALTKQQFYLEYQPRIELDTGEIRSVEALVRWNHPIKGIVGPSEFISLAEETGFIVPLGEWVLREACVQMKRWLQQGLPPVRVAVNISARQVRHSSLLYCIKDILAETCLNPSQLEIEFTESALMTDEKHIYRTLEELRDMGIYVSIDDFGMGYSSLNYLKRFAVNALKIDRSFVKDLPKEKTLPKLIISLARKLKLQIIAEGVETYAQHTYLLKNGCHHAQGFLYSKPLSAVDIERLLNKAWDWTKSN